jgi:hypothetical protein
VSPRLSKRPLLYTLIALLAVTLFATSLQANRVSAELLAAASASPCPRTDGSYSTGYGSHVLDLGDANGDGKLDLVVANRHSNYVSFLKGTGAGGFLPRVTYTVGSEPYFVKLGDVSGDGKPDLAVANNASNSVSVLINSGSGAFGAATSYAVQTNPQGLALADLNEDNHLDLIASNRSSNTISVLLNKGAGTFDPAVSYSVGPLPMLFDVGDIDGDDHLDVVVSSSGSTSVSVLLGDGTGVLGAASYHQSSNTVYGSNATALADLDGDGGLDFVTTTGGGNSVTVVFGDGSGGFGTPTEYPVGSNPVSIAIDDLDGDGVLDIVVANWYTADASILIGNGDGTFMSAAHYPALSNQIASVKLGDLNADGRLDLVLSGYTIGAATVMLGQPPDLTPPTGSIQINQGAAATASPAVTLNLSAQDAGCGVASMAFSDDGITYSAFEPYASTKAWTLSDGDGTKTVYAQIKDRANNVSQPASATIVLDQTVPTGTIAINNGAAYASNRVVTLAPAASDSGTGVKQMYLSDGVTSSGWMSYTTSAAWTLAGSDGNKSITAKFRDAAGNVSALATAAILLDTAAPLVTVAPLSSYQSSLTFPVTWLGTDATSGVASYDVEFRDGESGAWTGWLTGSAVSTAGFAGQEGHTYWFRARARDNAGNIGSYSAGDTQTTVDATPPVADRLLINFGALETTGVTVSLSLHASDAASGVAVMSFSDDGASWSGWQPYVPTAIWSLAAGDGVKTVYGRFRDLAGNVSDVISDTIVLNTFVATDYGLTINQGALFTNQTTVTLTIGAPPGTTQMQVSNDGGFAGVSWEPYTSHKTWQISQYGTHVLPRVVYIKYKDQSGTISSVYQDDIILDVLPPTGQVSIMSHEGAQASAGSEVTLELSADDDVSGVSRMRVSNQANLDDATWQPYASTLAWDMGASNAVYVQFRDYAGNISQAYMATRNGKQTVFLPFVMR